MKYKIVLILLAILAIFSVGCSVYQNVRYFEPPLLQFMLLGHDMPEPFSIIILSSPDERDSFAFKKDFGYTIPERYTTDKQYKPFITQIIGSGVWEKYTDCYLDTWYMNLKKDGTLYIMRGLPRTDYDFRKKVFMPYINRFYVCKLTQEDLETIQDLLVQNAEMTSPPVPRDSDKSVMYPVNGYLYYDDRVYEANSIYNYREPGYLNPANDAVHPMREILYFLQTKYPFPMMMEENF